MSAAEEPQDRKSDDPGETSDWPYASLLVVGMFGVSGSAAKKTLGATTVALLLVVVSLLGLAGRFGQAIPDWIWAVTLPLAVAWIGWANIQYLRSLDELGRELQLKAFALSYGVVMTVAAALVGVANAATDAQGFAAVDAHVFFLALVLAEPVRGVALAVLAKKYR